MNAPEVLDHKADLLVRLENPLIRNGWRDQTAADMAEGLTGLLSPEQIRGNAAATIATLWHTVPEAHAFHVTEEMSQLVAYAASQLEGTDRVNRMMMPTASGIVRFDGGLPYTDVRGKKLRLSWAVWGPMLASTATADRRGGRLTSTGEPEEWTAIWMFNDQIGEPDEIAQEMFAQFADMGGEAGVRRVFGRWGFMGTEVMSDGMRLGPAWREPDEAKIAEILADGDVPRGYSNPIRLMHAFFLLTGQTVAQTEDAPLSRAHRKRAERRGIPARVSVIRLRHVTAHRAEGESLVEWNHRWVVRGHPAWRVCGPDHPLAEPYPDDPTRFRVRVWIAPFVKGPEGKPLVVSEKVYDLRR